jgi:glycosyltransferase involved in cell wall biosynthesis
VRIALFSYSNNSWTDHFERHCSGLGHTVRVISFSEDKLPHADVVHIDGLAKWGLPKIFWFFARLPEVWRAMREFQPDVVMATYLSSNGLAAALTWRGPLVVSGWGGDILRQAGYLAAPEWLLGPMMRFVCGRAAEVHVVSEELAQALVRFGVPRACITCFPLGVSMERFAMRERSDASAPLSVVCTRRQEEVYGNRVLIDAMALLRDEGLEVDCTVIGGGPLLESYVARTRELNLESRLKFVGEVGHGDLPGFLRAADVYVSASSSDGTSSSLLEAMASGLYPVVSDITANRPWVEHGKNGLLFAVGDAQSLAGAIRLAAAQRASLTDILRGNRQFVEREGNQAVNDARLVAMMEGAIRARQTSRTS